MPAYDSSVYDPPAPIARVTVRNPVEASLQSEVDLLIDTGADATVLPRLLLNSLSVVPVADKYELAAFDGTSSFAEAADLDLVFLNRRFRGRYLLTEIPHGVLGRGILNHLQLVFDGPARQWSELASK